MKGVWWRIFEATSDDPRFECLIVDCTIVRTHQHAAGAKRGAEDQTEGQAIGRSRGGLSIKIRMEADADDSRHGSSVMSVIGAPRERPALVTE
jgi:hypothetical protein